MQAICSNTECDENGKPKSGEFFLPDVAVLCGNCLMPCEVDTSTTNPEPDNADPAN